MTWEDLSSHLETHGILSDDNAVEATAAQHQRGLKGEKRFLGRDAKAQLANREESTSA